MRTLALAAALFVALAPIGAGAQGFSTQRISGKRIADLASQRIAMLPRDDDHAYVPAALVPDQVVSVGHVDLRTGAPIGSTAFINVPVTIDVDGHADRTVFVGYRVQQYVTTAVAAHDIAPGAVLSADDLVMARVPFAGRPGNGLDALVGRKIVSPVLKGQPVTIEATAENQIVKAGSTVIFIVHDGGVAVSADAIARTGGGLGDQVFVYNPSTHKALSGTVTGPGTVELDISGGENP